jgi:aspartate aminotransferase
MGILSKRTEQVTASVTLAITNKANELKKQGFPIISFGAGEPDFDTPEYIKNAAKKALDDGFTKYTANAGIIELRKAICDKFLKDNNLTYTPQQIVVSNGAKHSLFNTLFALCNEGDEVIIFSPYWVTYIDQVKLAGGIPVIVETKCETGFRVNIDDFKSKITNKTKLVIINSPSNPTGAVYPKEDLEQIAQIIIEKNLLVISDEIYEKIVYDTKHYSIASFGEEIKKRTIVINGFSKAFSMTGWRIGYLAAEENIAKAIDDIQSHMTSNANSIAQKASFAALSQEEIAFDFTDIISKFKERRDYIVSSLNEIKGVICNEPKGAFYVFPNIKSYLGKSYNGKKINNTIDFCSILLEEEKIALVPGDAFGDKESIRLSYALGLDDIKAGIERLKNFLLKMS